MKIELHFIAMQQMLLEWLTLFTMPDDIWDVPPNIKDFNHNRFMVVTATWEGLTFECSDIQHFITPSAGKSNNLQEVEFMLSFFKSIDRFTSTSARNIFSGSSCVQIHEDTLIFQKGIPW